MNKKKCIFYLELLKKRLDRPKYGRNFATHSLCKRVFLMSYENHASYADFFNVGFFIFSTHEKSFFIFKNTH